LNNRRAENKKIKGSATLVVIISSFIVMLYAQSTYSDVRHMKQMYQEQEKIIVEKYDKEYNDSKERLEK